MFASLTHSLVLLIATAQSILIGLILGIVQGISEWLPISSKTQVLVAATYLTNLTFSQAYTLGLFMEVGTILAAVIYFRNELLSMARVLLRMGNEDGKMLLKYVFISMIFTGIIGAPLYLIVDSIKGAYNLGIPMLLIGAILLLDAFLIRYSKSKASSEKPRKTLKNLGIKDFILVGIAQGIAALPGVSRSGITTSSLILLNVQSDEAFRLSFLNSIFATSAAVALTVVASHSNISVAVSTIGAAGILVAVVVSLAISLFLIGFLIRIAGHSKIVYFVAALGVLALMGGAVAAVTGLSG